MAVPLAVGPMLAGLAPGGITQVAAAGPLDQSQTNTDGFFVAIAGPFQHAQTFTAGVSGTLDQVSIFLARIPPNGPLTVEIKATTSGMPSGLPLARATVPATSVSILPASSWVSVPLSPPAPSSAGTVYAIVVSAPTTIAEPYAWGSGAGDPYPRGDPFTSIDGGVSWAGPNPGSDFAFQTFVSPVTTCDERDGEGDIEGEHHTDKDDPEHSHKAHFQMSRENCEDHDGEHVDMEDPDAGTSFHSTHVDSVSFDSAAHALTVTGTGFDNGVPVSFVAVAVDHGAPALDTFSIVLTDGYSNAGHLLDGAITLH